VLEGVNELFVQRVIFRQEALALVHPVHLGKVIATCRLLQALSALIEDLVEE
jgi:hypothetical protein